MCKICILGPNPFTRNSIVSAIWAIADDVVLQFSSQLFVDDDDHDDNDNDGEDENGSDPSTVTTTPSRIACAKLMIDYMLVKKKKIVDLSENIRGGAGYIPGRVLDWLSEPGKDMGLDRMKMENESSGEKDKNQSPQSFLEWDVFLLGF